MKKGFIWPLLLFVLLTSCGNGLEAAPYQIEDAKALIDQGAFSGALTEVDREVVPLIYGLEDTAIKESVCYTAANSSVSADEVAVFVMEDAAGADRLARSGEITFSPCHEHGCVGPMAGIVSPSMPVHIVENRTFGNRSYSTVNEGLGKVLRFGANSQEVLDRLRYIKEEFFPVMRSVVELAGGVDLKNLTAQGLSMGDECHNRNKATTALLLRDLLPFFMEADFPAEVRNKAMLFLRGNEHYYLNLSMAACKCTLDAAHGVPNSTIVTTMARNGVEFGIRVSGMPVDCWFTGPAQRVEGLLFPGFQEEDAALDLGDSAITETCGIGGFAMAAAPAIVQFVGGCVEDAFRYSRQMYEITETESGSFFLPPLDFRGSATGIDLRKVVEAGILPVINTGIAHREAGVGQIGAGIVHPPMACFEKALLAFS